MSLNPDLFQNDLENDLENDGQENSENEEDLDNGDAVLSSADMLHSKTTREVRRQVKRNRAQTSDALDRDNENERRLDRAGRWEHFQYHRHLPTDENTIIRSIYGELSRDSDEYCGARQKLLDHNKRYKCDTMKRMKSLIIAHAEDKLYAGLLDVTVDFEENANLMRFMVTKAYSIQNYMYVWNYMKGYLDIEKSSSLGQFYCKKTFVLLGIEMAKVIRAEKSGKPGVKDREQQAHAYYYALPKFKDFVNVNKACFYETFVRGRCERRFKRIKTDHTAGHSEALQRMQDADSGTPPPSPPRVRDQSLSG